jgi:nucleosome binding factor SPN SPT16 subunit
MVNERGEELTCETRGYGFIASLAAMSQQDDCVRDAEKRGYRLKKEHGE